MMYKLTWLAPRLYLGVYKLRSSGGCYYFHIPVRLASLETRRVRVLMQINAGGCGKVYHGSIIVFPATLTQVGESFRTRIPSKFRSLAESVKDCGSVDVWIEPIPGHFNRRKEGWGK
jgi:hypothetical protein